MFQSRLSEDTADEGMTACQRQIASGEGGGGPLATLSAASKRRWQGPVQRCSEAGDPRNGQAALERKSADISHGGFR